MPQEIIKINNNTRVDIKRYLDGKVASKTPYVSGKKHGIGTWWHENGTKSAERYYLQNKIYAHVAWNKEGIMRSAYFRSSFHLQPKKLNSKLNQKIISKDR